jgi:hypothetical protein
VALAPHEPQYFDAASRAALVLAEYRAPYESAGHSEAMRER